MILFFIAGEARQILIVCLQYKKNAEKSPAKNTLDHDNYARSQLFFSSIIPKTCIPTIRRRVAVLCKMWVTVAWICPQRPGVNSLPILLRVSRVLCKVLLSLICSRLQNQIYTLSSNSGHRKKENLAQGSNRRKVEGVSLSLKISPAHTLKA